MRTLAVVFLAGCGLLAALTIGRAAGPSVSEDTPVEVLTTAPIRIILPVDPGEDLILSRLVEALEAQASEVASLRMRTDLDAIAADTDPLALVANDVARQFADRRAAAVALAMYEVTVLDGRVVISAITAEVIPQYTGIGISIDHENGHAFINDEIALACGTSIAHRLGEAGYRGVTLERAIRSELWRVGDLAHEQYHGAVNGTGVTAHRLHARAAAATAIADSCT